MNLTNPSIGCTPRASPTAAGISIAFGSTIASFAISPVAISTIVSFAISPVAISTIASFAISSISIAASFEISISIACVAISISIASVAISISMIASFAISISARLPRRDPPPSSPAASPHPAPPGSSLLAAGEGRTRRPRWQHQQNQSRSTMKAEHCMPGGCQAKASKPTY